MSTSYLTCYYPCVTGLPQGMESQDSEQFFRKVLGVSDGSSLGGMKPILEGSKGELNRSALPQRALLSGVYKGMSPDNYILKPFWSSKPYLLYDWGFFSGLSTQVRFKWSLAWYSNMEHLLQGPCPQLEWWMPFLASLSHRSLICGKTNTELPSKFYFTTIFCM